MDIVRLRGDPYSVGQRLGAKAAPVIRDVVFDTAIIGGLTRWLGSDRLAQLEAAARRHFPQIVREIEGIADGAGITFEEAFLWNCRGDLNDPAQAPEDSCTTVLLPGVLLPGPRLPGENNQAAVIAHNEDGAPEFADLGFLARVEPDHGMAFTAFCYPGMLPGHAFGVNDAGLVQTINNIRPHDLTVGIPRHVITRAVLACDNLDDALDLLRRTDRAAGFHHNLGEAARGRLLSVEAPASGCGVVEITAPSAHANHLIRQEFSDLAQTVTPSSAARQSRADDMLMDGVGVGVDAGVSATFDPLTILFDRGREDLPILCRGETGSSDSYTLATALFRLGSHRIDWSVYHGPDRHPVFDESLEVAERQTSARISSG